MCLQDPICLQGLLECILLRFNVGHKELDKLFIKSIKNNLIVRLDISQVCECRYRNQFPILLSVTDHIRCHRLWPIVYNL